MAGGTLGQWSDKVFGKGAPLEAFGYNSQGDKEKRDRENTAALDVLKGLQTPVFEQMDLQGPEAAADVTFDPATQQYGQVTAAGPSEYGNISVDPQYKAAQLAQLQALQDLQAQGGMNMQDRANLAAIEGAQGAQARGQRDAVMQNLQATGRGGSGMSLLAQLDANQNAQNQASQQGLQVAGMAQNRGMQAGQNAAQLAGGMQSQEWNQESQKAAAADAINRMNAQNLTGMSQYNAGQGNQMGEFNATGAYNAGVVNQNKNQNVNNAAANAANQSQIYNKYTMPQTQYQNEAGKAGVVAGGYGNQAATTAADIERKAQEQGTILSGIVTTAAGAPVGPSPAAPKGSPSDAATAGFNPSGESMAAYGGKVPGHAQYRGDSPGNDNIQLMASPGEVVVPRSMVDEPAGKIGSFVHNAQPVGKQKEAMLAAIKNMRRHGR